MKQAIQIFDPLEKAFHRMVDFCFRPFDFAKWMIMGFVTWVVFLGEDGGGSFNFPDFGGDSDSGSSSGGGMADFLAEVKNFFQNELTGEIILIASAVILVVLIFIIAIWIVTAWVKARFEFIFLDDIILNKADIAKPWKIFCDQGNSLLKWNIFFTILSIVIMLPMVMLTLGIPVWMCWSSVEAHKLLPEGINGIVIGSVLLLFTILIGFVLLIIAFIVRQLLIPLMYKEKMTISQIWNKFRPVLKDNKGNVALFVLAYWGVGMAAGAVAGSVLLVIMLCTCCFCCLGFFPFIGAYLGAVLMLPVTVFLRYFSYEYVSQFQLADIADIIETTEPQFDSKDI